MLNVLRIAVVICLLVQPFATSAATLVDIFTPGTPYYFDSFEPGKQRWVPGQHLNFEEVFKNYQYYEIVLEKDGKEITVNRYSQGSKSASEKYLVLPDGSLIKK